MPRAATHEAPALKMDLRARVEAIILQKFGRVEEQLFDSGLLDSLRAIELGVLLEGEFGIPITDLTVHDLASVTCIVEKLRDFAPVQRRTR